MTSVFNQGLFFWRDLRTTDPEKAKAFYTELLGWTIYPQTMGEYTYDMIGMDFVPFGGITPLAPGETEAGVPSHWISYVGTPDVDATTKRVAELGGTVVMEPMDIPTIGRFSVATDPTGAYFCPMNWATPMDVDPFAPAPVGGVTWNELYTSDVDAAVDFYSKLNGYAVHRQKIEGAASDYVMLEVEHDGTKTPVAGVFQRPQGMPVSAWGIYFRVADVDAAVKKIGELGGRVMMPAMDVPDVGRIAAAMDPTGAMFNVHQVIG
jgi:predicted enzyme related to lactoylglutathione lyase